MKTVFIIAVSAVICFTSCSIIKQSPKYGFADGRYSSNAVGKEINKVYVVNEEEVIHVFPLEEISGSYQIDTSAYKAHHLAETKLDGVPSKLSFRQNSFDVDFLTMPFKYRFAVNNFPRQFNTNLNGAVYLGYRTDLYMLNYKTNILDKTTRETTHFGFSFGAFTGLGGTTMNPWVTNNQIGIEYDGVVWSKGISGIIGLNSVTTGLAIGWDHLLDGNRKHWIYQNKPWIGFVFGLNLN